MELKYENIVLRDYNKLDIEDDIRWFNVETKWIEADTPWEEIEPVDEKVYREEMLTYLKTPITKESFRRRLELEIEGKHIGFVTSYSIDENYNVLFSNQTKNSKINYKALGIEICESKFWGQGYGTKALIAYIFYHLDGGIKNLFLETWSGNIRMMKCAEKIGFEICQREIGKRIVNNCNYDRVIYKLNIDVFILNNENMTFH